MLSHASRVFRRHGAEPGAKNVGAFYSLGPRVRIAHDCGAPFQDGCTRRHGKRLDGGRVIELIMRSQRRKPNTSTPTSPRGAYIVIQQISPPYVVRIDKIKESFCGPNAKKKFGLQLRLALKGCRGTSAQGRSTLRRNSGSLTYNN